LPNQAEFFGEHGEDEVGVALGEEFELGLGAFPPALAEDATGADGDGRLDDMKALAERVGLSGLNRVMTRLTLVVVQDVRPYQWGGSNSAG
jgi:hypothetical protein